MAPSGPRGHVVIEAARNKTFEDEYFIQQTHSEHISLGNACSESSSPEASCSGSALTSPERSMIGSSIKA